MPPHFLVVEHIYKRKDGTRDVRLGVTSEGVSEIMLRSKEDDVTSVPGLFSRFYKKRSGLHRAGSSTLSASRRDINA